MPFSWDDIPYTNFHELNLDYFINKFKQIFDEWADLYDTLTTWKNTTTTELETWKTQTENDIITWENNIISDLNTWKSTTETDISSWETATLNALDAWKTATTAIFEAIRVEAAGSATAAANSATAAQTAKTAAETAQAAAEAAAASVSTSAAQITTNTNDINDLKAQTEIPYENLDFVTTEGYIRYSDGSVNSSSDTNSKTNYIDIHNYNKIKYKRQTTNNASTVVGMAFYDVNREYIAESGIQSLYTTENLEYIWFETNVPISAYYARFTTFQDTETYGDFEVLGKRFINNIIDDIIDNTENSIANIYNIIKNNPFLNIYSFIDIIDNYALLPVNGTLDYNVEFITTDYITVDTYDNLLVNVGSRFWFYTSDKTPLSTGALANISPIYSDIKKITVPDTAKYFRISVRKTSESWFNDYKYLYGDKPLNDFVEYILSINSDPDIKLYCIGDSITRGMYTDIGDTYSHGPTIYGYPYWIGKINNYSIVNLGVSGAGYANKGDNATTNGKDIVDNNTFSGANIITIALGVNDYKGDTQSIVLGDMNSISGDGTVIGNMKYMIETLADPTSGKAKKAQIIIMLPMNENRFSQGDLSTNWAFGYAFRDGKTLSDYRDAIKECAEYYNLKVIDEEEVTPINRLNIRNVLGDGLHPTLDFYKQMGYAFAPLIK